MHIIPNGSKFHFYYLTTRFPYLFSLINTSNSRKLNVSFRLGRLGLLYVNFVYCQQWNSNWYIAFFNSCFDFWILGCTSNFFLIQKKIENWDLLMLLLVELLNFFPIREGDVLLGFFNVCLGCTSKFLSIH